MIATFFYRETTSDEVSHVHRHLIDLSGVELLDITQVPHVALTGNERSKEERIKEQSKAGRLREKGM